jgi:hypothetical protein
MHRNAGLHSKSRVARSAVRPLAIVSLLAATLIPAAASAQAWFYPSFQVPTTSERDYNFAVSGGGGTAFVFQWREGMDATNQLSLDAGLADPDGASNTKLFVGGQYARQLARASNDQPLDLLFTVGVGAALGDGPDVIRLPVGLSVGHRFPLDGALAITPFVHPRISLDSWTSGRGEGTDRTRLSLDFDLGGSLEVSRNLAVRASLLFSGGDGGTDTGLGVGLTYTPSGLRRP